jgi:hypothetical protein
VRRFALIGALAALAAAGSTVGTSAASFTAHKANPANTFTTAADWVAPALTLTAPAAGSYTNDKTPALGGASGKAATDSATVTAKVYSGSTATGTALQTPTVTRSPTTGTWSATATTLADGTYTAQATQSDTAGNTATRANVFTVDTKAPTPVSISAANGGGGAAGRLNAGDTITYRFSEGIEPSTIMAGFAGGATTADVNVGFLNNGTADYFSVIDTANNQTLTLDTSVASIAELVTANLVWPAKLSQSADGTTFTVVLGTAPTSGVATVTNTSHSMAWTAKAGPKDYATNPLTVPANPVTETDGDRDF